MKIEVFNSFNYNLTLLLLVDVHWLHFFFYVQDGFGCQQCPAQIQISEEVPGTSKPVC